MTRAEAAEFLGVPVRTLGQWAYLGTGPSYFRLGGGGHARYRRSDVEAFLEANRRGSAAAR